MDIPQHLVYPQRGGWLFTIFSYVLCQDLFSFKWHQTTRVHMYIPPQTKHCSTKPEFCNTTEKSHDVEREMPLPNPNRGERVGVLKESAIVSKESLTSAKDRHYRKGQMNECCKAVKLFTFLY